MDLLQALFLTFVFIQNSDQEALEQHKILNSTGKNLEQQDEVNSLQDLQSVSQAAQNFALSLYSSVAEREEGNIVLSPLSVQLVLALALTGAGGTTAAELASLLSAPENMDETTLQRYSELITAVQDPVLTLANRMFIDKSFPVKEDYQKTAEKYFHSQVSSVNFSGAPEVSRVFINSWVEQQTNDKIKDLLQSGVVSADTRLVLVNAIYFKANWFIPFNKSSTKERTFHVSKTEKKQIPMMTMKTEQYFYYDEELAAKFLVLNYEELKFHLLLVLPDDTEGLSNLESKLKSANIFDISSLVESVKVTVALPKFKIEKMTRLNEILESMGAWSMFDDHADLRGISTEDLKISAVIQKAFIEVNERGTEASGSAAGMATNRMLRDSESFLADHPFLFFIVLSDYQIPIFCGRVLFPDGI